ncbi:MAG: alpha/beta hydrolase [Candidatus Rokubacteria bacterium]|nr:alpha/beta hydrolase [Candidatus Rokubacteria bacterium]
MLLLHSLAAHLHWWDWAAPFWAARRRVVALDFRGHGASAHATPPAYGFEEHARDVEGVLSALGLGPGVLVGHSMGAYVGAVVAARRPDLVGALVIADMLSAWTPEQAAAAGRQAARPPVDFATRAEAGARFRLQPPDTTATPEMLRHLGESGVREVAPGAWRLAFDRGVFGHPPVDPWPVLPGLRCPTLVLHGEGSRVMDRVAAERVGAAIPRATVVTLPGAFHHLGLDQPASFAETVDEWLTTISSRTRAARSGGG